MSGENGTGGRSPWGGSPTPPEGDGTGNDAPDDGGDKPEPSEPARGPRNPWLPGAGGLGPRPGGSGPGGSGRGGSGPDAPRGMPGFDNLFRARPGGGGGGNGPFPRMPQRPDGRSWFPLIAGGLAVIWVLASTTHMIGPKEQGIVTTLGKYSRTITPGVSFTLPWPLENVRIEDVTSIKRDTIPEGEAEKLMLTSDQNLVDISYLVRWNIKDLKLYAFQLADPDNTVKEVAEAAMRASIAEVPLTEAMGGTGRALIEQNVRSRMQAVLDTYRSGVLIQGVEIKKADPPNKVIDAFQKVTAAQQDAQREQSNAQAWAQQVTARAQGDATAFDKVYEQYKLAPEVTRRRMYYETMERVLSNNQKVIVAAPGVTSYLPLPEVKRNKTDGEGQ
ncbi:protease modulator HflK [Novosphingobium flavum]|uniref:Protease modulator HflK n=2 Tax=Novosphingobium flavum TaxID=1778672 RepID=A0A7X1FV31_9SPHN|nr:protease modulator HflK [Novosphingobium flavum]